MTTKFYTVLKHELKQKIRSKAFIVLTLIGPLLGALTMGLPILASRFSGDEIKQIALIDSTGVIAQRMIAEHQKSEASGKNTLVFSMADASSADSLTRHVLSKSLYGYLIIGSQALDPAASYEAPIKVSNPNDFETLNAIERLYSKAVSSVRMERAGVDPGVIQKFSKPASIQTIKVTESSEVKESGGSFIVAYICGFILYIAMLIYGTIIMRSVIEEKSSRVLEIVVSSIDPFELLLGKVLGVGLAGILQMTIWALMLAVLTTVGISSMSPSLQSSLNFNISPFMYLYLIAYFLFGYLIFATLYAVLGSTADQDSDVQQVSLPITFLIIIPIVMMTSVIQSPNSSTSVILSLIPFFSPILMLGRIFSETPPVWQIALSFVLMAGTFFGILWIGAKVYRVGILMYGKRFTIPEVIKWIRYS